MAIFVLKFQDWEVERFESNFLEPSEMQALRTLAEQPRFAFERLVPDVLPPAPEDSILVIAKEIVGNKREYSGRIYGDAMTCIDRHKRS